MAATDSDTQPSGTTPEGIVGFLLARIAEDERSARARVGREEIRVTDAWRDGPPVEYRYDPAKRAVADCTAKRAIVADHTPLEYADVVNGHGTVMRRDYYVPDVLRHLADAYSDHPDYRKDWSGAL